MKKTLCLVWIALVSLIVAAASSALAMGADYTGEWVCLYVDTGNGVKQTEYEGQVLQDVMKVQLNADGSFLLDSFGSQQSGTWQPTGAGLALLADGIAVPFTYTDGMLVNSDEGTTMYFGRAADIPQQGGFNTLLNLGKKDETSAFDFAGNWKCIAYEASGVSYDINLFFPDGIPMTLNPDGTGAVQITPDYTENITWTAADGGITIGGSYILSDPEWDAATGRLSLNYASDIVRVVFVKADDSTAVTAPPADKLPQVYICDLFTVAFPANWVQNEYNTFNWGDQYYSVQYELMDDTGATLSSMQVVVSIEEVAEYRRGIDELLGYAKEAGQEMLPVFTIGGVAFQGITYGDYWIYTKYLARVPEASITIAIMVSDPQHAQDVLQDILDSIAFTYTIPDPPLADPPLAADGVPYQPSPTAIQVGGYELKAEWLTTDGSVIPKDQYNDSVAAIGDKVYVLASDTLYGFDRAGATLQASGPPVDLVDDYKYLSACRTGTLYISDGYYQVLAYSDGATEPLLVDGYLSMHPDGQWGLCYWSSLTVKKITFTPDGMAVKDWALKDLSDDALRQGRFSSVDSIMITDDHIYVAGSDITTEYAVRIVMYDFDGNERAVFGSDDWMDESAFGSVAGIVETDNGILVLDGLYQKIKLFSKDGTFLGMVSLDELLGTSNPWPLTMVAADNGALALLAQKRTDGSAAELLLFEITGF
jgi:hypothetical protein